MKTNKTALDIYKELHSQTDRVWEIAIKMSMYNSIDAFIDSPTDAEYNVISDVCYRAYMKVDEIDFIRLTDRVAEEYSLGNITLDYLREVSPYKLLDEMLW